MTPKSKHSIAWAAGGLITLSLLAGAYAWVSRPSAAASMEPVTIASNTVYAGTCPVLAAQERGYFSQQGIVATIQAKSSGKAAMEAVLQGQANLGTAADIPIMFAGLNNRPVSVIATIFKADKDHGVVGRRDRGVTRAQDLKGKRLGVTLNTSGHFALDAFLNRQRLAPSDVTLHNYKPEEMPRALAQGEVDAVATWEPFLDAALSKLGSNGVALYGEDVYAILFNIVGMRDFVTRHPETIKKVLRALIQGARFCNEEPAAARAMVAAAIHRDQAKLEAAWPSYRFYVALDQGLLLALEDEAQWAIKNQLTSRTDMPNYLNLIYLDGLEAVLPAAVTIIH